MNRWLNRVAVVTGASSGIGAASCKDLVAKGMVVVALARRENQLQELKAELPADQAARFHYRKCDVSVEQQVIDTFAWVDKQLGGADVLINSAGVMLHTEILNSETSADLRSILDINVLGVSWCTREAFLSMQRRKIDDGHVVIVNSIAGHHVPVVPQMSFNMYAPSKYAITALTEVLRQEFLNKGTKTKITSISPGAVDTQIIDTSNLSSLGEFPLLRSEDVADAISYCIQTPPNVQIHELTIKPIGEKF
ncbi:farnesol dehydrogenase-like [Drosophila montana]|uniref:farnesol dehydrogenase-like n=1 Tax=Drosophila montana TaxID=40370 RepID=UPI00313AE86E